MTTLAIDEQQIEATDQTVTQEASVRTPHERWMDRQTARARAAVDDAFARGALRLASHAAEGPMLVAAKRSATGGGRRAMTVGDLAVILCTPRVEAAAGPKGPHAHRRG